MRKTKLLLFIFFISLIGRVSAQISYGEPALGEIRMVSFNFAPKYWAKCDGQLLQISQNQALFSILGTTYGGDGITNFALPDLRGRTAVSCDNTHLPGSKAGEEFHILTTNEMPAHVHSATSITTSIECNSGAGDKNVPASNYPAVNTASGNEYSSTTNTTNGVMTNASVQTTSVGGGQSHNNLQPNIAVNYIICINGIYPTRP